MLTGMLEMIVKMSLITGAYVALTFLLWKSLQDRKLSSGDKLGLGFLYGLLSIFSIISYDIPAQTRSVSGCR